MADQITANHAGASLTGRNYGAIPATTAEGWTLERLSRPSRLSGANGLRTGADNRLYVAQVAGSRVSAIDVDSGVIETISPTGGGIVGPDDLAFDDEGNLYATEITENRVSVLRANGTYQVIQGDMPVANPITFHRGHLIAGELRMGGRILELDRNGGAARVIYEGVPMVNAFEVGPDGKLYFPAQAANEIWRIDLAGGEPEVVATGLGVPDSVKFHPDGYIVSTQVHSGQVLKIDPVTGAKEVLADIGPGLDNVSFVNGRTFVSHITGAIFEILAPGKVRPLVERGLQWPTGIAADAAGNLLVADGGFAYDLPVGGSLKLAGMLFSAGYPGWIRDAVSAGSGEWIVTTADGVVARWRPAAQEHEVIASGYDRLMGVAIAPGGAVVFAEQPTGRVLAVDGGVTSELATGLSTPTGVAIGGTGTVYVAEAAGGRVVKLVGSRTETVLDGLVKPESVAVRGDSLYVLDTGAQELVAFNLVTGERQTLASSLPVGTPQGVIVQPLGGVGDMCGPMLTFAGLAVGPDGTLFLSGDAEGSVLALRPA